MKLFKHKPNSKEYTKDMLPHKRKEVFFDVLKLQWKSFLLMGALILAAAIPLLACYAIEQVYSSMMLDSAINLENTSEYMAILNQITVFSNVMAFVKIPFFMLLAVILSGVARMVRQYAYEECVLFSYDFSEGIKQNCKQSVLLAVSISLIGAISYFAYGLMGSAQGLMGVVMALPMMLFVVILLPIAGVMTVIIPVYNNKFSVNIKWATYIFIKKPFRVILSCICVLSVFAVSLIPNFYAGLFGSALGYLLLPIAILGFYLFMFNILDELINKDNYPEIFGKGTF